MAGKAKKASAEVIPQDADELTGAWFTKVLPSRGTVTSVEIEDIGENVGFLGRVYRCHLTWDGDDADGPASVIVKIPTGNDVNFAIGDGLQCYEREIMVYQELRSSLGLPMPNYLYGAMDPDPAPWIERPLLFLFEKLPIAGINWVLAQFLKMAGASKRRYVLVIEDIENARPPTQAEGGSLEDATAALEVLAKFHAHNWMRTDVPDKHKRVWSVARACRVYQASYARNAESFRERYGKHVDEPMLDRLDEIDERADVLNRQLAAEPWTLLHGDYRLDNVLFKPDGETIVLDLQSLGFGRPAVDVAYFITTALEGEHRSHEESLLRTYHDALVAEGVTSYTYAQLVNDCSMAKEVFAHRMVGAADILDTEKSDGTDDLLDVMQIRILDWLA